MTNQKIQIKVFSRLSKFTHMHLRSWCSEIQLLNPYGDLDSFHITLQNYFKDPACGRKRIGTSWMASFFEIEYVPGKIIVHWLDKKYERKKVLLEITKGGNQ